MKEITRLMINEYKLKELGYDFMGFSPNNELYTAHHLIIPKRAGGKLEPGNTAILMETPHRILHTIESKDFKIFSAITSEMLDEVLKGKLDDNNILEIYYLLDKFYKGDNVYQNRLVLRNRGGFNDKHKEKLL